MSLGSSGVPPARSFATAAAQTLAWAFADDVDIGLQFGFERDSVDRAPTGAIGDADDLGDAARLLRRNDVCDIGLVAVEIRDQRHRTNVDRSNLAALR